MAQEIPPRRVLVIEVEVPIDDVEHARNLLERLRATVDACIETLNNDGEFGDRVVLSGVRDILRVSGVLLRK